jgi:hypothetical protein
MHQKLRRRGNRPASTPVPSSETFEMPILKQSAVLAFTMVATLTSAAAWADNTSPVGLWRNVDDTKGTTRALIRITEVNGTLQGKIEKVFLAPNESPTCVKCEGALKNAPVIGLVLKKDGAEYTGGQGAARLLVRHGVVVMERRETIAPPVKCRSL